MASTTSKKQYLAAQALVAEYEAQQTSKAKSKKGKAEKGVRVLSNGVRQDVKTGKFLSGPRKGAGAGVKRTAKKTTTSRTTSRRVVTRAPKKGESFFLIKNTRESFIAAAKQDGYDLKGRSAIVLAIMSVTGKPSNGVSVPKGYLPKGFKLGERTIERVKGMTKAERTALLNR